MPNLRTAIIGLGMMGTNHARVLSNLEGVELVAVEYVVFVKVTSVLFSWNNVRVLPSTSASAMFVSDNT